MLNIYCIAKNDTLIQFQVGGFPCKKYVQTTFYYSLNEVINDHAANNTLRDEQHLPT